jgi:aryl-alcohol dehydrogenase-like predicted oxidoreductase
MERRDFLKAAMAAATPLAAEHVLGSLKLPLSAAETKPDACAERAAETIRDGMPYRILGKTGEWVSLLGLGGYHIGMQKDERESIRIIRTAIDRGINFMDNGWSYHSGVSELRMGKALLDGYRRKAFLMTKVDGRSRRGAARQIDESLKRLQTDCVDLLQVHEIFRLEEPDQVFASGGAMEALLAAQKAGKLRFIGFSTHKSPQMALQMLDVARKHDFRFDAVQMPLNVMDPHYNSFCKGVVPLLVKERIGVLAMKSMGGAGRILTSKTVKPVECLHYAMSLPTSTVISGMQNMKFLEQNLDAARNFKRLGPEQMAALLQRTAAAGRKGEYEIFKSTTIWDGFLKNPEYLE